MSQQRETGRELLAKWYNQGIIKGDKHHQTMLDDIEKFLTDERKETLNDAVRHLTLLKDFQVRFDPITTLKDLAKLWRLVP